MKKIIGIFVFVVFVLSVLMVMVVDKLVLVFVVNVVFDFWKFVEVGVKVVQKDLLGYELQFCYFVQGMVVLQNVLMDDLVVVGIDVIMILLVDLKNLIDVFNWIVVQVLFFIIDSDVLQLKWIVYFGLFNIDVGVQVGEIVVRVLFKGGKCMGFVGFFGVDNVKECIVGFRKVVEGKGIEFVDVCGDDVDFFCVCFNVDDVFVVNLEIICMVGFYFYNLFKIYEVLKVVGKFGKIIVVVFDEDLVMLGVVKDGFFVGMVVQDFY